MRRFSSVAPNTKKQLSFSQQKNNSYLLQKQHIRQTTSSRKPLRILQNYKEKYISQQFCPVGLRNIGNTCFLNSIIQFLYAAEDLRDRLISKYQHNQNMSNAKFAKLIGKLFSYMKQRSQEHNKIQQILNLMVNRHQHNNTQYLRHFQEDALQSLLSILLEIQEKHPNISTAFDVESRSECLCGSLTTKERVMSYSPNTCTSCNCIISQKLISQPKYIIYSNAANERVFTEKEESMQVQKEFNPKQYRKLVYRLKAQIIYMGNGRSGHYIAYRLDEGKPFLFNDQVVYPVKSMQMPENGLILLYQLSNKENIQTKCKDKKIISNLNMKGVNLEMENLQLKVSEIEQKIRIVKQLYSSIMKVKQAITN